MPQAAAANSDATLSAAAQQVEAARNDAAKRAEIKAFFDEITYTITYVIHDPATGEAAIVDPVLDYDPASGRTSHGAVKPVAEYVRSNHLKIEWLLETHAHADHLSAAPWLQEQFGGRLAIGEHITEVQETFGGLFNAGSDFRRDGSQFDRLFADGERFRIGNLDVTVMHVPGHTYACIAYVIGDAVFVGDTMFMPDYGSARADFPGGDARTLYRSVRRILSLPDETRLFMCHDYLPAGRNEYIWETTVAAQRKANVHAHDGIGEDEFVAMRESRDKTLSMPRLILPAIQINMRAGHFPPPEDNGTTYLKIPVNAV